MARAPGVSVLGGVHAELVVTGVAGSGKSSLVHGSIPPGAGVVSIDQAPSRAPGAAARRPTLVCSNRSARRSRGVVEASAEVGYVETNVQMYKARTS
jgi:ABC-type taurine transport system ATPase subunit